METTPRGRRTGPGTGRGVPRTDDRARQVLRQLVDISVELLRTEGRDALQARRLATELGTSTKAVYHYVGGMPQLLLAVAEEGYRMLDAAMRAAGQGRDPVKDIGRLAIAYRDFAHVNPALYQLMYGPGTPVSISRAAQTPAEPTVVESTFLQLFRLVERAVAAGRLSSARPDVAAVQLWVLMHGYVTLEHSGAMRTRDLYEVFLPLAVNALVGLGGERRRAQRSIRAALASSDAIAAGDAAG